MSLRPGAEPKERAEDGSSPRVLGLVVAPGVARELAEDVAQELPDELRRRHGVDWRVEVVEVEPAEPSAHSRDLIEAVRRRLLDNEWTVAVGLTELPLRSGRRPVTAHASASHGVGLVSVPALGALRLEERLRAAIVDLVDELQGEPSDQLASPLGRARVRDDGSIKFVRDTLRGNLGLLVGMVRANQPSRVVVRLSRALLGALGTGAFGLISVNVWTIADGSSVPRLVVAGLLSIVATCVALVLAHHLWARSPDPAARERVILLNLGTVCTLAIGVVTLYLALFAVSAVCAAALIPPHVLEQNVGHAVGVGHYLRLAWFVASLATIGGALGSLAESDLSVRNATYRSRDHS